MMNKLAKLGGLDSWVLGSFELLGSPGSFGLELCLLQKTY